MKDNAPAWAFIILIVFAIMTCNGGNCADDPCYTYPEACDNANLQGKAR